MPVVAMNCPVCGKMATEYEEGKWQCLSPRCQVKFLYEKPPFVMEKVGTVIDGSTSQGPAPTAPGRYRAVSLWAVLSAICGAASAAIILLSWPALVLPLAAVYFGWLALQQIQRLPEEYTGRGLAQAGMGLGAGLGILLTGWLIFGNSEVPHGYKELKDYSVLEPDPNNKTEVVPPSALELSDKKTKVYVRGYIVPGRRQVGLTEFSICRTSDQCRFVNKTNRPTDMIRVELTGDRTLNYTTHQIGVGGTFQVDIEPGKSTPYTIKADYLYP